LEEDFDCHCLRWATETTVKNRTRARELKLRRAVLHQLIELGDGLHSQEPRLKVRFADRCGRFFPASAHIFWRQHPQSARNPARISTLAFLEATFAGAISQLQNNLKLT